MASLSDGRPTLLSDMLIARAIHFLVYLSSKKSVLLGLSTLFLEETAVFFEDPRRDNLDIIGARHVVLRSTTVASIRIIAALAVTATGTNLPPLLIWKGAKQSIQKRDMVYTAHQE